MDPERTLVVFLGDNLYPNGLPAEADPWRREGERRLAAQADAALDAGARVLFLPGNHDWDGMRKDGLASVVRQERFLAAPVAAPSLRAGRRLPRAAPSPDRLGRHARRPRHAVVASPRGAEARRGVVSLRGEERGGGRRPAPRSRRGGAARPPRAPPARERRASRREDGRLEGPPLPAARRRRRRSGSRFPASGRSGSRTGTRRGRGRTSPPGGIRGFVPTWPRPSTGHPALFQASGHDHSLQVLEAPVPGARWVLVSGSGIYPTGNGRLEAPVRPGSATTKAGFLRVRLRRGGSSHLTAFEATAEGKPTERFATDLR